jgi:hypothetical protein
LDDLIRSFQTLGRQAALGFQVLARWFGGLCNGRGKQARRQNDQQRFFHVD